MTARLVLGLIAGYQRAISPLLGPRCRFHPSCSSYAAGAVERFGVARGLALGAWRILRCNPFSDGGHDPVPDAHPHHHAAACLHGASPQQGTGDVG